MTIIDPQPPDVDTDEAGTALAPSDNPTEHAYAWALYPDGPGDDEFGAGRTTLWLWLCVVITAVVVAVLAGVLVFVMRERPQSTPTTGVNTTSVEAPTSAAPAPAEAPPNAVTVTESPSETVDAMPSQIVETLAPAAPTRTTPSAADLDERFMGDLTASGMLITSVSAVIEGGHEICTYLAAGHTAADTARVVMTNNASLTPANAQTLVSAALAVYCPQFGG